MKVLGESGNNTLICEVSRDELEKFFNCYYKDSDPTRKTIRDLKSGSVLNLGSGYDHLSEINSAFNRIKEFVEANDRVIKAISSGLILMAKSDSERK